MALMGSVMELSKTSPPPRYAVFDFDGSIIFNDSAEAVLLRMALDNYPNAVDNFKRYYSLLDAGDTRAAYRFGASTLQGLSITEVDELVRRTMELEGREIFREKRFGYTVNRGIALRTVVMDLFYRCQNHSIDVWVVSASPDIIVRSALKYFGLRAKVIGVRNIVNDELITAELREPLSIFEGKVACIQELIHPNVQPLLGIGDSMNDLPMLRYSRCRGVVKRSNPLAEIAIAEGWPLLSP